MRKIIKKLKNVLVLLIICFSVILLMKTDNVYSSDTYGSGPGIPTSGGGGGGGGSGGMTTMANGYRVSVLKSDGTMPDGLHSTDYWPPYASDRNIKDWTIDTVSGLLTGDSYYIKKVKINGCSFSRAARQKQNLGNCNYTKNQTFSSAYIKLLSQSSDDRDYYYDWNYYAHDGYNSVFFTGQESQKYGNYFADKTAAKFEKNYQTAKYAERYLSDCGYTKGFAAAKADNLYITIEPLAFVNVDTDDGPIRYYGSTTELASFGIYSTWVFQRVQNVYPIIYSKQDGTLPATVTGIKLCGTQTAAFTPAETAQSDNCSGVAIYWLNKNGTSCDTELQNALKNNDANAYNTLVNNQKGTYPSLGKLSFNDMKLLYEGNYTSASCSAPDCDTEVQAIYKAYYGGKNTTYMGQSSYQDAVNGSINATTMKSANGADEHNVQLFGTATCQNYTCQDQANAAYNKWTVSVGVPNSVYEKYITWLKSKNPGSTLLDTATWEALGFDGPECNSPPLIITPAVPVACTKSVKFEDSASLDNIKDGYAYSLNGTPVSSDLKGVNGCTYVCKEKVEFVFPGRPDEAKAGTVFKWGTSKQVTDQTFGEMSVEDVCYIKPATTPYQCTVGSGRNKRTATCYSLNCRGDHTLSNSDFEDLFMDTKIKLTYDEPSSTTLDLRNVPLKVEKDVGTFSTTTAPITCGGPTKTTNSGAFWCNGFIRFEGKYDIKYDEKTNWFSSKVDSSLVTKQNVDSPKKNWYYEIGWGLPTDFTTPNFKTADNNTDDMYILVTNVGRKQPRTGYHFNTYIKYGTNQDTGAPLSYNGTSSFQYSCGFDIKNELFGDDCEYDSNGNLKPGSPDYCDLKEDDQINPGLDKEPVRGIDVVFRTIDLINKKDNIASQIDRAFPGRLGKIDNSGRQKGHNWSNLDIDPAVNDTKIADILDDTVYSKAKPQYHIELTVAKIYDIRKMNREAKSATPKLDPFSEMTIYNYSDDSHMSPGNTGYYCAEGTDVNGEKHKYCASHFVSILKEKYGLTGSCIDGHPYTQSRAVYYKDNGCTS